MDKSALLYDTDILLWGSDEKFMTPKAKPEIFIQVNLQFL